MPGYRIVEVNARLSRSSALASKAHFLMVQIIIFLSFQGYYQILSDIIRFLWYHRSPQGIRSLWSHSLSETSWNVTGDRLSLGIRGCQDRIGWHGPSWVLTRSYGVPHKSMNNLLLSVGKPMVWGTQLGLGKLRQFFFDVFCLKKIAKKLWNLQLHLFLGRSWHHHRALSNNGVHLNSTGLS